MIGDGKEKGGTSANGEQSWRELAGPRRSRVNSPQARKRRHKRWFKLFSMLALTALVVGGIARAGWLLNQRDEALQITPPSRPIERILFDTDGVLPDAWLSRTIDLRPGMSMMQVDIRHLKQALEAEAQVKSASVERVFPSDLRIVITEHQPVMRLAIATADGQRRQRIVARDGTVYDGVGYPRASLKNLPYVQPYQHPDGSFFPLRGIERVAELLDQTRNDDPQLFASWQVISLEHYSGDLKLPGQVIEVRSTMVPRILFSAATDFARQLDRLAYILEYVRNQGNPSLQRIDLSLRESAAVQFSNGPVGRY